MAWVSRLTVPLVEAEPVVLAGHRVAIIVNLPAPEVGLGAKDPQVHHDLGRLIRNRWVPAVVTPHWNAVNVPGDAVGQPLEAVGVKLGPCVPLDAGRSHLRGWPKKG